MPQGTGAETAKNIPGQPFTTDPGAFFQMTKKNIAVPHQFDAPGFGQPHEVQLPQAGILSLVRIIFDGTLTVTDNTGSVDTTARWPYGLADEAVLSINGSNELWRVSGEDLAALDYVRHPSHEEATDVFPGTREGEDTGIATGDVHLTWTLPVAVDDVSLVGSLYLQSAATVAALRLRQAAEADVLTVNGDATVDLSGDFHIETTSYEVPFDGEGNVVVPDLSRLHGVTAVELPLTNLGTSRHNLIRYDGQLARLFVSATRSPGNRLSAQADAADADKIAALALTYGGNKTPYDFDPATFLVARNNRHYGQQVPYERLVIDQVRENPQRDAINMAGLTELAVELDVDSAVTLNNGKVRLVQEMLF